MPSDAKESVESFEGKEETDEIVLTPPPPQPSVKRNDSGSTLIEEETTAKEGAAMPTRSHIAQVQHPSRNDGQQKDCETGVQKAGEPLSPMTSKLIAMVDYRRILRRIDVRLLPYTCLLNFLSHLDKYNLSQAHARDLDDDLHLQGNQFAALLSVYFPAYLVLHYISAAFVQQLRTRRFIPTLILLCGFTTVVMSRADSFTDMAMGRFMLGVFEGAITPCITILYTSWYPSEHMAMRITIFRLAAPLAGMASALVCAAFYLMDGIGGLDGWRWMFIAEGLITFILAFPGYWLVPNFIEQDGKDHAKLCARIAALKRKSQESIGTNWFVRIAQRLRSIHPTQTTLSMEQRELWSKLLVRQTGPLRRITPFTWRQILRPFVDLKMWLFFITAGANQVVHSNMVNFAPEVIKSLGFSGSSINLLSAGPLAFSVFTMLFCARVSDKYQVRGVVLLPCLVLTLIGQLMLTCYFSVMSSYLAIYLVAGFSYPCNSLLITWCAANVGPQYTKNSAMAVLMVASTATALISANIFPPSEAPRYLRGHLIGLISIILATVASSLLMYLIKRENQKREKKFPLTSIDPDTLHAAMQYDLLHQHNNSMPLTATNAQCTTSKVDPDEAKQGEKTQSTDTAATSKEEQNSQHSKFKSMSDDEARTFWHLTHLTNEEFARLGERHPGIRLNL